MRKDVKTGKAVARKDIPVPGRTAALPIPPYHIYIYKHISHTP